MPTTARLIGAVLLAALAFLAATMARPYLPDGEPAGMLTPVSVVVGVAVGWLFTGRHLDRGRGSPVAIGFGSAVLLVFWVALLFGITEMIDRSKRNSYRGSPTEAVQDVFNIMYDYAVDFFQFDLVAVLALGGILAGVITGWVGRRFR